MDKQRISIPLTQGFAAYIDAVDIALISKFKWRAKRNGRTVYAISDKNGKRIWMHKIILNTQKLVDHIDNNGLNNCRINLRILDNKNNIRRKRPNVNSTSNFKGVSRFRITRWQASIKVDGKSKWLGSFDSEKEAAIAYDNAAKKYFGEYAYLNFK